MPRIVSSSTYIASSQRFPVRASTRRMPAATLLSLTILNIPIRPVLRAWMPPQNSQLGPKRTTRTVSPYFSPNKATAPIALASSTGVLRCSSSGRSWRIRSFTRRSTSRSSSSVTFWKCEKSKRSVSGATNEPFCSTCSPSTAFKA